MKRAITLLRPAQRQRGAAAIFLLLLISGVVMLAAYASDGTRMTADAAQLKRATDAAALAAAAAYAESRDARVGDIAQRYVEANLGMDRAQLGNRLNVVAQTITAQDSPGVRVTAMFSANAMLNSFESQSVTVSSAAISRNRSLEVALILPNSGSENAGNLQVLRRLGKRFATRLLEDTEEAWLALVPFSQSVNVYDPRYPNRVVDWSKDSALRPVELTSLFRNGYRGLDDRRIPDRAANLTCLYRGLSPGDNYFWTQAPAKQFQIYYRHDLPINGSPGAPPISWVGPNPDFGQATGVNDTRFIVADKGCPNAPLLPLTNDMSKIEARLDQMSTRFNTNYAIAMGWAAMALAPAFRGDAGWGLEDDLPLDFDDGTGDRIKAVILLVNSTGQRWFDTDSYNAYVGEAVDNGGQSEEGAVTRRFRDLCNTFKSRRMKFYMLVVGEDETPNNDLGAEGNIDGASEFRRIAGPGLRVCSDKASDQTYLNGRDFVQQEGRFQERLDAISDELRQLASMTTLIE